MRMTSVVHQILPFLLLASLLLLPAALATTSQTSAIVSLHIINKAPILLNLEIIPTNPTSSPTAFHELVCAASVEDEFPESTTLDAMWTQGDTLLGTGERIIPGDYGLSGGETITCTARAVDDEGARSNALSASITLVEASAPTRFIALTTGLLGEGPSQEALTVSQEGGLTAITGYAVASASAETGAGFQVLLILLVTGLLGANLLVRSRYQSSRKTG